VNVETLIDRQTYGYIDSVLGWCLQYYQCQCIRNKILSC